VVGSGITGAGSGALQAATPKVATMATANIILVFMITTPSLGLNRAARQKLSQPAFQKTAPKNNPRMKPPARIHRKEMQMEISPP
jgi:hypothetical protein